METRLSLIKLFVFTIMIFTFSINHTFGQKDNRKVRIAKIEVYPLFLDDYKAALAEHAETAVRVEPGVLSLQAVNDKKQPTLVTVFEVYTSEEAYQAHLKTGRFLKYKNGKIVGTDGSFSYCCGDQTGINCKQTLKL